MCGHSDSTLQRESNFQTIDLHETHVLEVNIVRKECMTTNMVGTHATLKDWIKKKIKWCKTVRYKIKGMPQDQLPRNKLREQDNVQTGRRHYLVSMVRRHKHHVHILTNMRSAPR